MLSTVCTLFQATSFNFYANHVMETLLPPVTDEDTSLGKLSCHKLARALLDVNPGLFLALHDSIDSKMCDVGGKSIANTVVIFLLMWALGKLFLFFNYSLYLLMRIITLQMAPHTRISQ